MFESKYHCSDSSDDKFSLILNVLNVLVRLIFGPFYEWQWHTVQTILSGEQCSTIQHVNQSIPSFVFFYLPFFRSEALHSFLFSD